MSFPHFPLFEFFLLRATSILTLQQKLSPKTPCVVLGLKSVISSLWTLCPSTAKVRPSETCSWLFQYALGHGRLYRDVHA